MRKKLVVKYGGGRTIKIPEPENITVISVMPKKKFDISLNDKGLHNLGRAFGRLKKKGGLI